jgi:hypothetical protein
MKIRFNLQLFKRVGFLNQNPSQTYPKPYPLPLRVTNIFQDSLAPGPTHPPGGGILPISKRCACPPRQPPPREGRTILKKNSLLPTNEINCLNLNTPSRKCENSFQSPVVKTNQIFLVTLNNSFGSVGER